MTTEDWAIQGARLTAEAIKTTIQFLPAIQYEIRLVHDDRQNNPVITRLFTRAELLKSVRFLRGKNAEGYHIYFRPDAQQFVFVDDVSGDDVQAMMDDGVHPVLVYETSKSLHHAWVQLANRSEQVTEDEGRQARIILAERYSGDKDATSKNQPGRLPGFRNVKPKHVDSAGGHPLVKIKRSCFAPVASRILKEARERIASLPKPSPLSPGGGVETDPSYTLDDDFSIEVYDHGRHVVTMSAEYEIGDLETAYARVLDEIKGAGYVVPIRKSENGVDRSRQDIAVVRYLSRQCVQRQIIEAVLLHGSDKAKERGASYVEKTINAVFNPHCSR